MNDLVSLLAETVNTAVEGRVDRMRGPTPGEIVSYDAETRRATVQALIMDRVVDGEATQRAVATKPYTDVPVLYIGSGVERIKFPVRPGDGCLLVFGAASIARWKSTGKLVDPGDDRRFHASDAIAITGFAVSVEDADALIDLDTDVKLGSSAAVDAALKGDTFLASLATLVGAIATAVGSVPGGTAAGTAISTALSTFQTAATSYKSSKVKVF